MTQPQRSIAGSADLVGPGRPSRASAASLWAKSADFRFTPDAAGLAGHTFRVDTAVAALLRAIGGRLSGCFDFDSASLDRLSRICSLAALLHDLGKATPHFQAALSGENIGRHPWRHETLSVVAILTPQVRNWLMQALSADELALLCMTIAGHHLRAGDDLAIPRVRQSVTLLLPHADLHPVWERIANILELADLPRLTNVSLTPDDCSEIIQDYVFSVAGLGKRRVAYHPCLLPVAKALLIAADTIGSAHSGDVPLGEWITGTLSDGLTETAIDSIVESRLRGAAPRPFQEAVAASTTPLTVAIAGCGNGKTLAAYLWARRHAVGSRLAFCYPTTGTTSAGFLDYLLEQNELERRLLHSRAEVDIEAFQHSPDDEGGEHFDVWAADVLERWPALVVACTADTVLSMMTNWRPALATLPLWANCAFVFDEVHSYDRQLFGTLLEFIAIVRAPILLMTASLSGARKSAIISAAEGRLSIVEGDEEIECAPRYEFRSADVASASDQALAASQCGEKVLWVVNTVGRAQTLYRELRAASGTAAISVYHSRFRYADRVARQADVIAAFRSQSGCIVIATQVCEMSLDISADLLITELAPFPSLIQRLGRLNRYDRVPRGTKTCLWYDPASAHPYEPVEIGTAGTLVRNLEQRAISQSDLADSLKSVGEPPYERRATAFLNQTWRTVATTLREATPTWNVVRRGDLPPRLASVRRRDVVRNQLSMPPRGSNVPDWPRIHGSLVVPDNILLYSSEAGASWAR